MERSEEASEADFPTVSVDTPGHVLRSLSLSVGVLPFQCGINQIQSRLECYIREKTIYSGLEDLEVGFISLSSSLREQLPDWTPSLRPLLAVHPLLFAASSFPNPALLTLAEGEVQRLRSTEGEIVTQYQWLMKVLELLGDLLLVWEIVKIEDFAHRSETAMESVLASCGRLDSQIILPEVICIALAPGPAAYRQLKIWCSRVNRAIEELLVAVAGIVPGPECSKIYEPTDSLNQGSRRKPKSTFSLRLPPWWRLGLLLNKQGENTLKLYAQVKQLGKEYLELERALAACKSY